MSQLPNALERRDLKSVKETYVARVECLHYTLTTDVRKVQV